MAIAVRCPEAAGVGDTDLFRRAEHEPTTIQSDCEIDGVGEQDRPGRTVEVGQRFAVIPGGGRRTVKHAFHSVSRALVASFVLMAGTSSATELFPLPQSTDGDCYSTALGGMSSDGRAVLTTSLCLGTEGGIDGFLGTLFRFDTDGTAPTVHPMGPGYFTDLSGDGRSALGNALERDEFERDRSRAFIVRDLGESIDLGFLPLDDPFALRSTLGRSISTDGATVVGGGTDSCGSGIPVIFSTSSGLKPLPGLPPNLPYPDEQDPSCLGGTAKAISGDGSVVVGRYQREAFLLDARRGSRPIAIDEPPGRIAHDTTAISTEGRFVVGFGSFDGEQQPYLWSRSTGMVELHDPVFGAGRGLHALDVSEGGQVVVGGERLSEWSTAPIFEDRAFVWTPERGARDLREALEEVGIDTSGWTSLVTAWKVSDDGTTVVGTGVRRLSNRLDTFRARLSPVPLAGRNGCEAGREDCFPIEVLARTGQTIRRRDDRDPSGLEVYSSFERASVNERGDVAFSGGVMPAFTPPDEPLPSPAPAVFASDGRGGLRACPSHPLMVAEPGIDEGWIFTPSFVGAEDFALLPDGSVVLSGRILSPSDWPNVPERDGIWRCRGRSGDLKSPLRLGTSQPDESGELLDSIFPRFRVDAQGRVSVLALSTPADRPETGSRGTVLATGPSGVREVLFRAGELPPGITDLPFLGATAFNSSGTGKHVIAGSLGDPFGFPQASALWATNASEEIALVYRSGDPAPGDAAGRSFGPAAVPAINDVGKVAFLVGLYGASQTRSSIWTWTPNGQLDEIVEAGAALPGLPPGRTLEAVLDPLLDERGDVLFMGMLDWGPIGQNDAYWLRTIEGAFVPLLRTGQQAPGLPEGVLLGASNFVEVPPDPELATMALSDSGLALLEFELTGAGIDATNDRALYLVNRAGAATLVVRRGDTIRTAADELRTVDWFRVWYGYRGETTRRPINDRGDVVAIVDFTDESRAVVRFSTPEPGTATALASASLALGFACRRRRSRR